MVLSAALSALTLFAVAVTQPEPREITWADLIPAEGGVEAPPVRAAEDHEEVPEQTGSANAVTDLDGAFIRMPGFMLPLDYTERGRISAFLLVPYYGACIHVPPPPPNQIVFVDTRNDPKAFTGLWDPVWVTGTLEVALNENDLGDAAYTLRLDRLEPYRD